MQSFRNTMRIRNIVEINPVVKGSIACDLLSRFKFFNFILGPMISDMTEKKINNLPSVPSEINNLRIFSKSKASKLIINILKICRFPTDNFDIIDEEALFIEGNTFKTLENEAVLNSVVNFINNGKI